MEFEPEDHYAAHRAAAKAWVAAHVESGWLEEQELTGNYQTPELHLRLARDGLLGAAWPAEFGGTDADPEFARAVFQEVLGLGLRLDGWFSTQMVLNTVLHVGTDEQKRDMLSAGARGEMVIALGYTEPSCGSDVAAAKTRAVRDGDEWVINGSKMFTSTAQEASHVFLLTRTNVDVPKHRGLTLFMVPLDSPGVEIRPVHTIGGQRTNATFYSDVRIPDRLRVGPVDGGWGVMRTALTYERGLSAPLTGPTWADRGADWARSVSRDGGSPVIDDPVVRERLARIAIETEMTRLLAVRNAWIVETGGMPALEGTVHKLFSTETGQQHLASLLDLIGEEAVIQDPMADSFPQAVESAFRKAVFTTIAGGSSEVQREIIAERALGLPKNRPS
ncbi:MAG TPA: acyl-CoA dehydrogenase family protein [Streptosporangiaceae bacterium]|nr:acyl-CoA dehydrogenase family protein [Streptosporangiaceae bacterium]